MRRSTSARRGRYDASRRRRALARPELARPPFDFDDASTALQHHLVEPPPIPSTFRPAISPSLDAWVLRLLEKEPRNRFSDAASALAALRDLGVERWSDTQAQAWWRAKEPSRPFHTASASAETLDASLAATAT